MKTKKAKLLIIWLVTLAILTVQLMATTSNGAAYERPEPYFKITLLAPTNNAMRVLHAQVITNELWKIGIDAELVLVGWDALVPRLMGNLEQETYAGGGFDIGFIGWTAGDPDQTALPQFFHSREISPPYNNWYPINDSRLDAILDRLRAEPDMDLRREYVQQALNILIWENHPVMGLYQGISPTAYDAAVRNIGGEYEEARLSFDDEQSEFIRAAFTRFYNLNPLLTNAGPDENFFYTAYSFLYQRDVHGSMRPILASHDPLPIGSNDAITDLIDPTTIDADSPYKNQTVWGPNPNIDTLQYNATVVAANCSMLLIPLRESIPWQPGYGYTAAMKLNATADDLLWTWAYGLSEDMPQGPRYMNQEGYWGTDYRKAVEKINATLIKVNFRGTLGNGIVPTWFAALQRWFILPRHILDPTFDATPYGGAVGVTPDGTPILPYSEHEYYRYNTGNGDKPIPNTGPYYMEGWDEGQQLAAYRKFTNWGGYGNDSLWQDLRFQANNIDTVGIRVFNDPSTALIALEKGEIDQTNILTSDVPYVRTLPDIRIELKLSGGIQTMGYNTFHPKLSNRNVRLAISHVVPGDRIVSYLLGSLGEVNEVVGVPVDSQYYPTADEWSSIGLNPSENILDPVTKKEIKFQGHIRYDLAKAWALMEKAHYDMAPFRDAVQQEEAGERAERSLEPFPILLASAGTIAVVGTALILGRRYWQQYVASEPEALQASRQRKRIMKAIALKRSSRIGEKAQAQELFQQLANDTSLPPELTLYAMLNLSDMLLDEARAYGEQKVLDDAERLSTRIYSVAQNQESAPILVEALLLRSKFVLLEGKITQADSLLKQAATLAIEKKLPKLAAKVAQEQATLAKEVSRWEALTAQAAPLRDRLEQARLQDYIASAVRIIELEEVLS